VLAKENNQTTTMTMTRYLAHFFDLGFAFVRLRKIFVVTVGGRHHGNIQACTPIALKVTYYYNDATN
jgi:hypothetical protein